MGMECMNFYWSGMSIIDPAGAQDVGIATRLDDAHLKRLQATCNGLDFDPKSVKIAQSSAG